jgi:hypothetical protein
MVVNMVSDIGGKNIDLGLFENRVLRRIFGPKRDEIWGWRKLYNKELIIKYLND